MLVKFALVSAVVTFAFSIPGWFDDSRSRHRRNEEA